MLIYGFEKVFLHVWVCTEPELSQRLGISSSSRSSCLVDCFLNYTVEPSNNRHFGNRAFVLYSEVVLWFESVATSYVKGGVGMTDG